MKMTRKDRIMAIMRHPEFQKDYKKYLKLSGEDQEAMFNTLCKKWKENITLVYIYYLNGQRWEEKEDYEVYDYGITLQGKPSCNHSGGRYLYLRIDLTKTREVLKDEFAAILKTLVKEGIKPKDPTRKTDPIDNHWQVYDMVHKGPEKLLTELAMERSNIHSRPWDNGTFRTRRKQLKRAYDKAVSMIKEIKVHCTP